MDESPLRIHEIKLVIQTGPSLLDGRGVAEHTDSPLQLGQISIGHDGWRLIIDADLESSWAPINELDSSLRLDERDGRVDVLNTTGDQLSTRVYLGNDVTTIEEAAGHVLAITRIAFDHLTSRLEAGGSYLLDGELLVVGLFGGDNWGVCDEREMDSGVGDQVCLKQNVGIRSVSLVTWNSVRSTFRAPSKRREAVIEETT